MNVQADPTLDELRGLIVAQFPDLASARLTLLTAGWDSLAVDADDRLIFKFPRTETAARRLRFEARLLDLVRPKITMAVPRLTLQDGARVFSRHAKLPGEHLLTEHYERLDELDRARLAAVMAHVFAELHALDPAAVTQVGAAPIHGWRTPDEIAARIWPVLPEALRPFARRTLDAWAALGNDPHGTTYGFFDGHGWNMAFDHEAGRLTGLYDFADSGFGDLHREFVYPNWISRDLTERIVTAYEVMTGRHLDRPRIETLSGALRLWELAEHADQPDQLPVYLDILARWSEPT